MAHAMEFLGDILGKHGEKDECKLMTSILFVNIQRCIGILPRNHAKMAVICQLDSWGLAVVRNAAHIYSSQLKMSSLIYSTVK